MITGTEEPSEVAQAPVSQQVLRKPLLFKPQQLKLLQRERLPVRGQVVDEPQVRERKAHRKHPRSEHGGNPNDSAIKTV